MAADPQAPWSRWDAPGFQYVSYNTQPPVRQFDTGQIVYNNNNNNNITSSLTGGTGTTRLYDASVLGRLVGESPDENDSNYYNCVYDAGNGARIVQQCLVEYGCCDTKCCDNASWAQKYGWAVALIVIFCIIVIIVVAISLAIWLLNRARDKRQRQLLESPQGMSPAPSQLNVDPYAGGPPPMGGPAPGPGIMHGMPGPYYQQPPPPQAYGTKPYPY